MKIDRRARRGGDRAARRAPRARRDGDGAGHRQHRHRQHGARDPRHLGAARARPARVHAGGLRRRGPAPRRAAGARAGDPARPRAAPSGHPLRARPAAERSPDRLRADAAPARGRRGAAGDDRDLRRAHAPRRRVVRPRGHHRRLRGASAPHGRHALRGPELRAAGRLARRRRPDPRCSRNSSTGFERAHEQMYGYIAAEEPIQAVTFRHRGDRHRAAPGHPRASSPASTDAGVGAGSARATSGCPRRARLRGLPGLRSRSPRARPSALPARPSSSRWTRPRCSCPARRRRWIPYLNLDRCVECTRRRRSDAERSMRRPGCRSDHRGGDRQRARLDRRGDGRDAGARLLLDQREGAARQLHGVSSTRAGRTLARRCTSRCTSAR